MKKSSLTASLYLAIVFASGILLGAFGQRLYSAKTVSAAPNAGEIKKTPEDFRKHYVETITARLQLSTDQVAKLNVILDTTRTRVREAKDRSNKEARLQMREIHRGQVSQIEAILDEKQRQEYAKFREERDRQRKLNAKPNLPPGA